MARAVELSAAALGSTSPNPPVGAVLLDRDGEPVGEGATQPPGGPHAEVVALRQAGVRGYGGTLVCTLEPCRHVGRTGPCTSAIAEAGIARVVYAAADVTPDAAGGAEVLRAAGIEVEQLDVRVEPLEPWLHAQRRGRPYVTWKYAATLDGRSAAADGTSRWITGEGARADVHRLRREVDAVLVGVGTVLADDPELTVRPDPGRQPLRVVLDRSGRTPADARVRDALVLADEPRQALERLYARGVVSVLLEGGPTVAASFVRAGLVDRVIAYVAPALLGAGPAAVGELGVGTIKGAHRLRLDEVLRVGDDVRLIMYPETRSA
ncbi:MAG: bifunctional diaminohydroxyphosphoribosylaminopyrimidine deaminase/5-amino-6-(5-phosphoribosylamino)uracil reductase RibD [Actinobacteria bacterium]|nr:bifunctional diaminohydroxyphosphoribosylaminopyrimidine deaminase/5-amino-6-(5-phosphoribosylamino)uracil reductase RibD [Actinomycetota bacterium]MCA1721613.1 bifunctional diaminohydroxyphosphoribosylaminopyrimidine deaminase/5-amino-6-(5-phosphoribosylamino)uracil reductase RibD [Actinomycetota bacterium]